MADFLVAIALPAQTSPGSVFNGSDHGKDSLQAGSTSPAEGRTSVKKADQRRTARASSRGNPIRPPGSRRRSSTTRKSPRRSAPGPTATSVCHAAEFSAGVSCAARSACHAGLRPSWFPLCVFPAAIRLANIDNNLVGRFHEPMRAPEGAGIRFGRSHNEGNSLRKESLLVNAEVREYVDSAALTRLLRHIAASWRDHTVMDQRLSLPMQESLGSAP